MPGRAGRGLGGWPSTACCGLLGRARPWSTGSDTAQIRFFVLDVGLPPRLLPLGPSDRIEEWKDEVKRRFRILCCSGWPVDLFYTTNAREFGDEKQLLQMPERSNHGRPSGPSHRKAAPVLDGGSSPSWVERLFKVGMVDRDISTQNYLGIDPHWLPNLSSKV